MKKSVKELESFQAMEEFNIVEKKLNRANETLKPFTIKQINISLE